MEYKLLYTSKPPSRFGGIQNLTECILQRGLTSSMDLNNCLAVATIIDDHKYFLTLHTNNDGQWWKNGLDDQIRIEDCIKLFESKECAVSFIKNNKNVQNSNLFTIMIYQIKVETNRVVLNEFEQLIIKI